MSQHAKIVILNSPPAQDLRQHSYGHELNSDPLNWTAKLPDALPTDVGSGIIYSVQLAGGAIVTSPSQFEWLDQTEQPIEQENPDLFGRLDDVINEIGTGVLPFANRSTLDLARKAISTRSNAEGEVDVKVWSEKLAESVINEDD